jgi:hypothetical protein
MQHRILAGSELEGWRIMLLNFLSFPGLAADTQAFLGVGI